MLSNDFSSVFTSLLSFCIGLLLGSHASVPATPKRAYVMFVHGPGGMMMESPCNVIPLDGFGLEALLVGFHGFGIIWGSKPAGPLASQETVQPQGFQIRSIAIGHYPLLLSLP